MMKFVSAVLALLLVVPLAASAAYDDATIDTNTTITANDITLTVTGTQAAVSSLVANSGNFQFTLSSGSSIEVTASSAITISSDAEGQYVASSTCGANHAAKKFSSTAGNDTTITVTPSSTACATSGGTGGGSSGGGGGGGGGATVVTPAASTTIPKAIVTLPVTPGTTHAPGLTCKVPGIFNRLLSKGLNHGDVKRLQAILNSDAATQVSLIGPGSPGNETSLFGPATEKAIQKFQVKYGVAGPGVVGYGTVGPKTRAKLASVCAGGGTAGTSAPSDALARLQQLIQQLQALQAQLKLLQGR